MSKNISKYLSYLLRHGATKEGLPIDNKGFIPVSSILDHLNNNNDSPTTLNHLLEIAKVDNKQRFSIIQENNVWLMRANQGHTINTVTEEALTPITDSTLYPEVIHGTTRKNIKFILKDGLLRMKRNHIHFASGMNAMSGVRNSSNIFIYADLQKALADGIKFYVSENGVILTPGNNNGVLEPKYFKAVIDDKGRNLLSPTVQNIPCAGVIVFKHNENEEISVCLVKTHNNVYGFPKGKRNKKEELKDCAYRELQEESGITPGDIEPLDETKVVFESSMTNFNRKGNICVKLYVTKLINKEVKLNPFDLNEIALCDFIPISVAKLLLMDKRKIVLEEALKL